MKRLVLAVGFSLLVACSGPVAGPKVGQSLDLKFTSLQREPVDLQALKGKVVLIDFWATWCPPCVAELPHVKAAYAKFHAKGFEIIGISFDTDENAVRTFTQTMKMEWPQYFDGKGPGNDYAVKYGVDRIPTMWLIDKSGQLTDTDGRQDLEAKVEKLLAQ